LQQGCAVLRQLIHDMGDDVGVAGFVRQQTAMIGRVDSRSARLDQVSDLGADGRYRQHPNAPSKEMADGIHGAKLVILENCGHPPQPEQPEATAAALTRWLRSQA
jgi:pimeloyl-ACP methyl ester carboxylesterase